MVNNHNAESGGPAYSTNVFVTLQTDLTTGLSDSHSFVNKTMVIVHCMFGIIHASALLPQHVMWVGECNDLLVCF